MASARQRALPFRALCAGLGVLLLACERKAPGPEECARFAEAVVHLSVGAPYRTPQIQAQIDDETRLCLTRPYDRELIDCVLTTQRARPCIELFRRRNAPPD